VGGAILTIVGGILLLSKLGLWYVGFRELWPLILIAVGLLMLWKAIEGPRAVRRPSQSVSSRLNEFAIFGGVERRISSQEFEGGQACAVFGGVELDLREAGMQGNQATIEANAVFGGVELRVPESWNVTIRGVGVFGGYSDQTRHPAPGASPAKELIVHGGAVFGAVEVRN
jgi:predicted membrane protein